MRLNREKLKEEGIYSATVKDENLLKYMLIRSEIDAGCTQNSPMASLPYRQHSAISIRFVPPEAWDVANRHPR